MFSVCDMLYVMYVKYTQTDERMKQPINTRSLQIECSMIFTYECSRGNAAVGFTTKVTYLFCRFVYGLPTEFFMPRRFLMNERERCCFDLGQVYRMYRGCCFVFSLCFDAHIFFTCLLFVKLHFICVCFQTHILNVIEYSCRYKNVQFT